MRGPRRVSLPLPLLVLGVALGGGSAVPASPSAASSSPAAPAAAAPAPTTRTAAEAASSPLTPVAPPDLAELCAVTRAGDHPFFGTAVIPRLRAQLAGESTPAARLETLFNLGRELFRLGDTDGSREAMEEARKIALAEQLPVEQQVMIGRLLAISHLRAGENANCVAHHTAASCIFPIAGEGIHVVPDEARKAGDLYLELLQISPRDAALAPLTKQAADFPHWSDVAPALGLAAARNNAGGAIVDDFDGDGLLDIVTSNSDPCGPMSAWRNDGRGGFEPVAEKWGLNGQLGGLNVVQADYDGDGMLDLLVLRGGWWGENGRMRKSLLRNDLRRTAGRFVDVTAEAGLGVATYPSQAAGWADYDLDGDLDLYIGNEKSDTGVFPSQLYRNEGNGRFSEVAAAAGVTNRRWAKGVAWGDYDDDGDPDLYVSNMGPNRLYRNKGDGTFEDVAESAGVLEPVGPSFATWFFDFDQDGDLDLWVNDYGATPAAIYASYINAAPSFGAGGHPVLYRNDGGGRFTDVSEAAGLWRPALPMGSNFGDLDNDGWPDVYLGTGNPDFDALMPNQLYRNEGGRRFIDETFAAGFGHLQKGHGVAFADLDNDGDQDVFEEMGGAYPFDTYDNALYENPGEPGAGGAWVTLRLAGKRANRFGVGARIEVVVRQGGANRSVYALVGSGSSFGGDSLQAEIGLGVASAIDAVRVRWPAGAAETFTGVAPNGVYELAEGSGRARRIELPKLRLGGGAPAAPHHHPGMGGMRR